jgi:hypothetical protein
LSINLISVNSPSKNAVGYLCCSGALSAGRIWSSPDGQATR